MIAGACELLEPPAEAVFVVWSEIDIVELEMAFDVGTDRLFGDGQSVSDHLPHDARATELEGDGLREYEEAQSTCRTPSASQCRYP